MKINKNIKIFINYFLGPVLFAWLSWSIYTQIKNQPDLPESWQHIKEAFSSSEILYLLAALLLVPANWGLEAYKWMLAVRKIQPITYAKAFKAVLSGVSFSVSTPNRVGEYFGRVLYVNEGNRIKTISLTIVGSISQLITTVFMGLLALLFLQNKIIASEILSAVWVKTILYGTGIGFVILTLFYFRLSWIVKIIDKLPGFRKYSWVIEALEEFDATLLLRFLSISISRFCIFIIQYYLLFKLFHVDVGMVQVWQGISVMFLVMAIIPTIALFTDLGLRNELSIKLMGLFSTNHLGISLTSISIWLINLVIPALIGSLLILGIRNIIKNKNESI
ncbi:MAG: lysylphosphatidylglycerol synthase domain-containing protein [Niabella sp.]